VKLAEDGSGDVIVRLYESLGQRSAGRLTANFPIRNASAVDLLERPVETSGVETGSDGAGLLLRPFQLVTLRLVRL
jgi:alpha-mannosidase